MQNYEARFPKLKSGYESYYLRAVAPDGSAGFWIRYTVNARRGKGKTGSLWCTLFTPDGPVATKASLPHPVTGDGDWIRIGESYLMGGAAYGGVKEPNATWDLRFRGASPFRHLPSDWMYVAPLPKTKSISLHPTATFDGTVTVGDKTVDVTGWRGMVGHNWGSQHAERWIWLHGLFPEGDWLDVVIGRLKIGLLTTPWIASGGLSVGGDIRRLGGPLQIPSTKIKEAPDQLTFRIDGVSGRVSAPRERFVGWKYADPDGSTHDVVNCSIADLQLDYDGRSFECRGLAAYELGMRERDHRMTIQPFTD